VAQHDNAIRERFCYLDRAGGSRYTNETRPRITFVVAGFAVSTAHFDDAAKKNIITLTNNEFFSPLAISRNSSHLSPRLVEASVLSVIELIPHFCPTPAINLMITRRVEDFFFLLSYSQSRFPGGKGFFPRAASTLFPRTCIFKR